MNADTITIESDDRGFELHLIDENGEHHSWNIQGIAEEVYDAVKREIGPWVAEGKAARHEYDRGVSADFPEMQPILDAIRCRDPEGDFIRDSEAMADAADLQRKQAKGE